MHLDTHAVVWLYAGETNRFSDKALKAIETEDLFVSPAVILELQYLREIERLTADSSLIIETLSASIGLEVADTPFREVVMEALTATWTRDPFDRLIASQARAEKQKLLTKDETILKHYSAAFWK